MCQRGGQALRVDLRLDGRRVHGELHPAGADQLHRTVDARRDDRVQHHLGAVQFVAARGQGLVAEHVVDQLGDPGVARRQVVQHLVGLRPQLAGVVRREDGQLAAQLVQRAAQRSAQQPQQLLVAGGQLVEAVLLPLGERGVALLGVGRGLLEPLGELADLLGAGRGELADLLRVGLGELADLLGVRLGELLDLADVLLAQRGQLGGVLLGELLQLLLVPLLGVLALLDQVVEGPPVGERHHRADQLVAVAHRGRGQVDRHLVAATGPQHLPAHPVLAPGAQGVGERGLLVREGGAVGARVEDQLVQLTAAEVARPVTQDLRGRRVHQHDAAVGVGADHALRGGPQDHLGLPLRAGEFGLGVDGAGEVADDQHQQLVAGVRGGVAVVGLAAVLQAGAGDLDRELAAVGAAGDHPGGLRPGPGLEGVARPSHRPGDQPGVELREQVEQSAAHQGGAGRLEGVQGDGVGVDDGAVGIDQDQRVGQRVQYGCEASSASGWPAAHETHSSLLPHRADRVGHLANRPGTCHGQSLRAPGAPAAQDERDVAREVDARCGGDVEPDPPLPGPSGSFRGALVVTVRPGSRGGPAPSRPSARCGSRRAGRTPRSPGVRPTIR